MAKSGNPVKRGRRKLRAGRQRTAEERAPLGPGALVSTAWLLNQKGLWLWNRRTWV